MSKQDKEPEKHDTEQQTDSYVPPGPRASFTVRLPNGKVARGGCRLDVTEAGEDEE